MLSTSGFVDDVGTVICVGCVHVEQRETVFRRVEPEKGRGRDGEGSRGVVELVARRLESSVDDGAVVAGGGRITRVHQLYNPVSYTHLTLPTIYSV